MSRYELDLEYKVAINRLTGTANITAVTLPGTIKEFTLDLADTLGVSKVTVNGRRPTHFGHRAGKLTIKLASAIPAGAAMTIVIVMRSPRRSTACGRCRI